MSNEQMRPGDNLETGGVKFDYGKARTDLLPVSFLLGTAAVLNFGAQKYADRNWEKGMAWSRPYGALLRHLFAWWSGEKNDPDSGLPHLWHAACNLAFLVEYEEKSTGVDDRPQQKPPAAIPEAWRTHEVSVSDRRA